MGKPMRALGLMSGTSMDGIDVAVLETDGEAQVVRGSAMTFPYNPEQRTAIAAAMAEARHVRQRTDRLPAMALAERMLTELHAAAVSAFLDWHAMARDSIDVVGFHGQTVIHRPEQHLTIQLGDGALLAELTGLPVVFDLRGADVAAGGQGAPLVPVYHRALVSALGRLPVAVVNIGGVSNVTWVGSGGELIAFDAGPGNALLDDWMQKRTGRPFDENGAVAGRGQANAEVLALYLSHEYFAKPPPKSLDRNAFVWNTADWMSTEDGAATLTAFSAAGIARAAEHFPVPAVLWVICGGGRRNATLMGMITKGIAVNVIPAEAAGLDGDSIEAEAWAYMAVRSLAGLPISFPPTTGVAQPMAGGILARPARRVA